MCVCVSVSLCLGRIIPSESKCHLPFQLKGREASYSLHSGFLFHASNDTSLPRKRVILIFRKSRLSNLRLAAVKRLFPNVNFCHDGHQPLGRCTREEDDDKELSASHEVGVE